MTLETVSKLSLPPIVTLQELITAPVALLFPSQAHLATMPTVIVQHTVIYR